ARVALAVATHTERDDMVLALHSRVFIVCVFVAFFFNDPATTEIYTLSLHDALPILSRRAEARRRVRPDPAGRAVSADAPPGPDQDRKSTRLNSSHVEISYAVFCLKKKK